MKQTLYSILILFLFFATHNLFARKSQEIIISKADIAYYTELNNKEKRLEEFKDNDDVIITKLKQLAVINNTRIKNGKPKLKLDILASRVANKMANQSIVSKTMGHYNSNGESPYLRYALAGGKDHVMENASSLSSGKPLPKAAKDILSYMQISHKAFMEEKAPNDGHKQNVLNDYHNYVGIGYALVNNEFRYYEEYIDRYLEFKDFKTSYSPDSEIIIPVKPIEGKHIYMAVAYYENFPEYMSQTKTNSMLAYSDFTENIASKILPWELPAQDTEGFIPLKFFFSKKGLYYIHIYIDREPYSDGKASTKNKIQSSGIVIEIK